MLFGLRNAPATFQHLTNRVVAGLAGCAVYLDDLVVYSESWASHVQRIRALFDRLTEPNLTVNLAKCDFARATVTYVGRVVGQGCVVPVQAKVMAFQHFPPPSTKKELMWFLGMVGYYRGFCKKLWLYHLPTYKRPRSHLCGQRIAKKPLMVLSSFCVQHLFWLHQDLTTLLFCRWMQAL